MLLLLFYMWAEVEIVELPIPAKYSSSNLSEGEHRHLEGLGSIMFHFTALRLVSDLQFSNVVSCYIKNINVS